MAPLPRIGLLGIMQELYDEMLPGITERQGGYARELGEVLAGVADVVVADPAKERDQIEERMRFLESQGLDGLLVVNLTYGPAMRVARVLSETRLPICLANIQPVPSVTAEWDMADLTYNQGIHGAQDTAAAARTRSPGATASICGPSERMNACGSTRMSPIPFMA